MIRHRLALVAGAAAALAMLLSAAPTAAAAALHGRYTNFDVPGAADTIGLGINDHGVVVGAYFDSHGNSHGFIGRPGKFTTVNVPGAASTSVDGINETVTVRDATPPDEKP